MEDYGWLRPAFYPKPGETEAQATQREARAVREGVGLFEASPLGKIEVFGPDAAEFLNRIYVNNMKSLKPGRCRYGIMLNENGIVFDDGVAARMAENHFLVGTTSAQAAHAEEMLQEWLQCEWVDFDVVTQNVTTGWAVINVNGPKARAVIEALDSDIDFSRDAFPHMHYRAGHIGGAPTRIQRVSFTGELSYEISVPWSYGRSLWDQLWASAEPFGGATPFGIQSLEILRTGERVSPCGRRYRRHDLSAGHWFWSYY